MQRILQKLQVTFHLQLVTNNSDFICGNQNLGIADSFCTEWIFSNYTNLKLCRIFQIRTLFQFLEYQNFKKRLVIQVIFLRNV